MNAQELYNLITTKQLSISTDSRNVQAGTIYFGLKGDVFDGNTFAEMAIKNGAHYAVIDNSEYSKGDQYILVDDSYKILQEIARLHRTQFTIPVLVIGGSNGKTTTKELVASVLAKKYKIHTTAGNLNNHIGVPLTLLSMKQGIEIAVIEVGANHPGEHAELMKIIEPTHVLVTNNGADHLEGFGSLAGVRVANKEIYDWAREHGATIFVNKEISDLFEDSEGTERIVYPEKDYSSGSDLYAGINYDEITFQTQLVGSLNEANILAAVAVGEYFKVSIDDIKTALSEYVPTLKRSQLIKHDSATIILDCYNANPSSMELSLNDFFKMSLDKKRITIVGDMRELGESEKQAHHDILELIKKNAQPADTTIIVGPVFSEFSSEYPFSFFPTSADAVSYFDSLDLSNAYVFVKASRGTKLEDVIKNTIKLD